MSLLTLAQLSEWRERVHQEYLAAMRATDKAIWRERLYRRYAMRFLAERDKANRDEMNAQS